MILFGIAIINYLLSPFLSLSDLCMLLLRGMFLVDVNRVEYGGRCFRLELLSALLFFIVLLNCPFSFFILSSFMFESWYVWQFVKPKAEKQ